MNKSALPKIPLKIFCYATYVVCSLSLLNKASAQQYVQSISGTPLTERSLTDLGGSPYFNDEFLKGSIEMEDHSVFSGLYLRYDQEADELTYRKTSSSPSMSPNGKVTAFSMEMPNGKVVTFKRLGEGDYSGFYEVISNGETSLIKKTTKKIVERVEYNSTNKSKSMVSQTHYFIQMPGGNLVQVKNDKKVILKVLGRNQAALEAYITKEDINFKDDNDLAKLMGYFNSLK